MHRARVLLWLVLIFLGVGASGGVPEEGSTPLFISRTGTEIHLLDESHPRSKDIQPWQRTSSIDHVATAAAGPLRSSR